MAACKGRKEAFFTVIVMSRRRGFNYCIEVVKVLGQNYVKFRISLTFESVLKMIYIMYIFNISDNITEYCTKIAGNESGSFTFID